MKNREQKIGKPAIYKIVNTVNNKLYIGSCVGHYQRKGQHWYRLRVGTHDNNHLQSSWNLYGEEAFLFEIIEFVEDVNKLIELEQMWIDKLDVCNRTKGYNKAPRAGSNLGRKMSKESREKMSKAKSGVSQGPETVRKRAESCSKAVECYDEEGYIEQFSSIKKAAEVHCVDSGAISKAISDKYPNNKTAGGFKWRFIGTS